MRDLHVYVADVEVITLRAVAGDGDQADMVIRTRGGSLTLRLLPRAGRRLRLVDGPPGDWRGLLRARPARWRPVWAGSGSQTVRRSG